jgi:hypothetical protein
MAIAKGNETKEVSFKRYTGIGNVNVLAINPTKAELAKLGREVEEEPVYVTEKDGVKSIRLSLYVKPIEIDEILTMSFFIRNQRFASKDKGTFQVIDSYARTAWVNDEQLKNHDIPVYSNGNAASIANNYRPAFSGEDNFTQFVKTYLGIPNLTAYVNGQWVPNPKATPADCEVRFDHIDRWFNNDTKEAKDAFAYQPNNTIQVLFGVRTDDQNREYQTFFIDKFFRGIKTTDGKYQSEAFAKEVEKINSNPATNGRYANTEFYYGPLKEYSPTATNFEAEETTTSDNPWD